MQSNLSSIRIALEFEFSELNQHIMSLHIADYHVSLVPKSPGRYMIDFDIKLPTKIKIYVSGKNQQLDTLLDDQGKIVKDLYVQLTKLNLDGIMIPSHSLYNWVQFHPQSEQLLHTTYCGFNGVITLDLDQDNVFEQVMMINRLTFKKTL